MLSQFFSPSLTYAACFSVCARAVLLEKRIDIVYNFFIQQNTLCRIRQAFVVVCSVPPISQVHGTGRFFIFEITTNPFPARLACILGALPGAFIDISYVIKTDCRFSDSLHRFQSRYAKFLAGSAARLLKSSACSQTCRRAASVYRTHSMRFHRTFLFVWMQISVPREIIGIKAITRLPTCRTALLHAPRITVAGQYRTLTGLPLVTLCSCLIECKLR